MGYATFNNNNLTRLINYKFKKFTICDEYYTFKYKNFYQSFVINTKINILELIYNFNH